ncbi:MAG: NifB/NifX family molybdenum-iron cluster-binding protein [Thermoflexales bacterium]|nr:NifB/NifX family molybdenum-iron cluster-binding protein [Thermoflexales bacterium]
MRIAISADDGRGLDSIVSPHFGRCPYFILVDVEERQVKHVQAVSNPHYGNHQEGQVPAFIHEQGADVMLAGGMGRRAIGFFEQYNIQAVTGAYGTVRQSLESYLGGQLQGAAPCRESVEHAHERVLPPAGEYEQDELGRLREEVELLRQQLDAASSRLDKLSQA